MLQNGMARSIRSRILGASVQTSPQDYSAASRVVLSPQLLRSFSLEYPPVIDLPTWRSGAWFAVVLLLVAFPVEAHAIHPAGPLKSTLAQARNAYSATTLRLREAPSTDARIVTTIPRGSQIRVGTCSEGWCEVTFRGDQGYAAEQYLGDSPPTPQVIPTGRGYTNSRGERVSSPVHARSAPAGATARCRDGTYSFSRSRRGTCSHHGGVAQWL